LRIGIRGLRRIQRPKADLFSPFPFFPPSPNGKLFGYQREEWRRKPFFLFLFSLFPSFFSLIYLRKDGGKYGGNQIAERSIPFLLFSSPSSFKSIPVDGGRKREEDERDALFSPFLFSLLRTCEFFSFFLPQFARVENDFFPFPSISLPFPPSFLLPFSHQRNR